MEPEKIHFIFSILFLIWCLPVIPLFYNRNVIKTENHAFWMGVCTLFFGTAIINILAYKYKKCWCYLLGAPGFLLFFVLHFANIVAFVICLTGLEFKDYMNSTDEKLLFFFSNLNFPLSIFALSSTLYRYQKMLLQQMDENYSTTTSSKPMLLKFCSNNFTTCIKIFNYAILLTTLAYSGFTYKFVILWGHGYSRFHPAQLLLLLPFFTPICNLLAIRFGFKKLCIVVITAWTLFTVFVVGIFGLALYDEFHRYDLYALCIGASLLLTYFMNLFVCMVTTLYIYQSNEMEKIESKKHQNIKIVAYLYQPLKCF